MLGASEDHTPPVSRIPFSHRLEDHRQGMIRGRVLRRGGGWWWWQVGYTTWWKHHHHRHHFASLVGCHAPQYS